MLFPPQSFLDDVVDSRPWVSRRTAGRTVEGRSLQVLHFNPGGSKRRVYIQGRGEFFRCSKLRRTNILFRLFLFRRPCTSRLRLLRSVRGRKPVTRNERSLHSEHPRAGVDHLGRLHLHARPARQPLREEPGTKENFSYHQFPLQANCLLRTTQKNNVFDISAQYA